VLMIPQSPSLHSALRKSSHLIDRASSGQGQLVSVPTAESFGFPRSCNLDRALGIGQEAHQVVEIRVPARFTHEEFSDA